MIGRTAGGNHQITVYTWNPRLMLFIMSEVKSGSHYWHVKGIYLQRSIQPHTNVYFPRRRAYKLY